VSGVEFENPRLEEMGVMQAKIDAIPVHLYGVHQPLAQIIMDEVGWK